MIEVNLTDIFQVVIKFYFCYIYTGTFSSVSRKTVTQFRLSVVVGYQNALGSNI